MTNTTGVTGHNKPWRYNNRTNTATRTQSTRHVRPDPPVVTGSHNNSPNSSDNRNGSYMLQMWRARPHEDLNAVRRESSAHTAGPQTTTPKHTENTTTILLAPQTATSQQDTTLQQHHHHY